MATAQDAANYILARADSDDELISNLKLQKLLYYAQGFHLALHDKPLFDESVERWMYGPVVPEVYKQYSSSGSAALHVADGCDLSRITESEKEVLDEVYAVYGQFSAWKLRDLTHVEAPWINAKHDFNEITQESMREFFLSRLSVE